MAPMLQHQATSKVRKAVPLPPAAATAAASALRFSFTPTEHLLNACQRWVWHQ
jgi:hypothetical protein